MDTVGVRERDGEIYGEIDRWGREREREEGGRESVRYR